MPPIVSLLLILSILNLTASLNPNTFSRTLQHTIRQPRVRTCGGSCRFSFCSTSSSGGIVDRVPFILFGPPGKALNRFICENTPNNPILSPITTGEPQIFENRSFIPLSAWRPAGLSPNFPPRFLRASQLIPGSRPLNGIAPQPPTGNQWSFLHNRCFRLPISLYTTQDSNGTLATQTGSGPRDCVAFRTTAPSLHVIMEWGGNGDGDLSLQEPSRNVVDFLTNRSNTGARLLSDSGTDTCGIPNFEGYTESIRYFPDRPLPSGMYVAEAWQASDCNRTNSFTNWSLTVVRDGVVNPMESINGTVQSSANYTRVGSLVFEV
eukprot:GFKZ01010000.1.p1 GENE.GFKZ01010000.1~~GFKZ01010000.1.p1  ORF type:complete len:348 (+),score=8.57 GFKZ01010000.1:83-1045(+)